jgi:cation transport ATPase
MKIQGKPPERNGSSNGDLLSNTTNKAYTTSPNSHGHSFNHHVQPSFTLDSSNATGHLAKATVVRSSQFAQIPSSRSHDRQQLDVPRYINNETDFSFYSEEGGLAKKINHTEEGYGLNLEEQQYQESHNVRENNFLNSKFYRLNPQNQGSNNISYLIVTVLVITVISVLGLATTYGISFFLESSGSSRSSETSMFFLFQSTCFLGAILSLLLSGIIIFLEYLNPSQAKLRFIASPTSLLVLSLTTKIISDVLLILSGKSYQSLSESSLWYVLFAGLACLTVHYFKNRLEKNVSSLRQTSKLYLNPQEKPANTAFSIRSGDTFRLKAGDTVPVDSVVVSGAAELIERVYSGYTKLVNKDRGQPVYASSQVLRGNLECKALCSLEQSSIYTFIPAVTTSIASCFTLEGYLNVLVIRSVQLVYIATIFGAIAALVRGTPVEIIFSLVSGISALVILPIFLYFIEPLKAITISKLFRKGILVNKSSAITKISQVKSYVADLKMPIERNLWSIQNFELLDDRFNKESLLSVLISLVKNSQDEVHELIYQFIRPQVKDVILYSVDSLSFSSLHDVSGVLDGVKFCLGTEDLLLINGVELQPSDFASRKKDQDFLFFSVGKDLVAKITISREPDLRGLEKRSFFSKNFGIKSYILSSSKREKFNELINHLSFTDDTVLADVPRQKFIEILKTLAQPLLLFTDSPTKVFKNNEQSLASEEDKILSLTRFDFESNKEMSSLDDLLASDVVLLAKDTSLYETLLKEIKFNHTVRDFIVFVGLLLSATFFICVLFGFISPGLAVISSFISLSIFVVALQATA